MDIQLKFLICLLAISFLTCKNSIEQKLELVEHDVLLKRIVNGEVFMSKLPYRNSIGEELSEEERELLNSGNLLREFYQDKDGKLIEIRVKPFSLADVFKEIQIREAFSNPFNNIELIELECTLQDSLIMIAYKKDQDVRIQGHGDINSIDKENQITVLSLIEKCGWPKSRESIEGLWFVIQHAGAGFMTYYYDKFKELESAGLLDSKTIALMEDRMLMNNGFPQIYGSQMIHHSVYQMIDPVNVNKRRAKVGLGTIEENTRRFGFEYFEQDYIKG